MQHSDDQCHAEKQMLSSSYSSHTLAGKQSNNHNTDSCNISTLRNCQHSNSKMATPEDNCQSMTTLVLPTGSPNHTSSSIQKQMSNHIESKPEYQEYVTHN